jgi:hypothetical protein
MTYALRLPAWQTSVLVNGRRYVATDGLLITEVYADAVELQKMGAVADAGIATAPEWTLGADGAPNGLLKPDGSTWPALNVWDDLRFPAQAINPAGAAEAPTVDQDEAKFPGTLLFAGNKDASISGIAQCPHAWSRGTALRPHIHWSKPVGSASAVD